MGILVKSRLVKFLLSIDAEWFSIDDVVSKGAFWQVGMRHEEHKAKTAFIVDGQLYEFNNLLPFGAMNAPADGSLAAWAFVAPVFGHM